MNEKKLNTNTGKYISKNNLTKDIIKVQNCLKKLSKITN